MIPFVIKLLIIVLFLTNPDVSRASIDTERLFKKDVCGAHVTIDPHTGARLCCYMPKTTGLPSYYAYHGHFGYNLQRQRPLCYQMFRYHLKDWLFK